MGKTFFVDWELWQKMTFVLACGIVATVFVGLCKLWYDTRKIRHYTKVQKGKQAAIQEPTPEMLESQREEMKNDIPFGIRAIESGIEVDGVWISRSNTPVGSSRSSMTGIQLPKSHNSSQLDLRQPMIPDSSRNSSRAPSSFDVAVNAERIHTNDSSRPPSPNRRGPPADSCTKCGHSDNRNRNSSTLQALEGQMGTSASSSVRRDAPTNKAGTSSTNNSGKSSRRTSDESDFMALNEAQRPYQPAYINPRQPSMVAPVAMNPRANPRTDLDMLQSHRMSHVAETGQLTPRVRKPGHSGEWASVADNIRSPQEVSTYNGVDYFVPQKKTPSPPPPPVAVSSYEAPVPSASRPAQDSNAANQARQAVPLMETYATRPFYLPETYQPRGPHNLHAERSYDEVPIEVNTSQNQQRDNTQVLRKVNSGFEVLRPGTFQLPSPEEEERAAMAEKRQSKRLQKKRRTSSAGSRTSAFTEQV